MNDVVKDIPASLMMLCPRLTPTSLNLPADLPLERWREIGQYLTNGSVRLQWWVADWWAFGEHKYGERYKAAEDLPFSARTCENYAVVARAFKETPRRRGVLSFSHHQLVAALDPAKADELLAWCAEPVAAGGKPRSTRELQERLLPRVEVVVTRVQPVERVIEVKPGMISVPTAPKYKTQWTETMADRVKPGEDFHEAVARITAENEAKAKAERTAAEEQRLPDTFAPAPSPACDLSPDHIVQSAHAFVEAHTQYGFPAIGQFVRAVLDIIEPTSPPTDPLKRSTRH